MNFFPPVVLSNLDRKIADANAEKARRAAGCILALDGFQAFRQSCTPDVLDYMQGHIAMIIKREMK